MLFCSILFIAFCGCGSAKSGSDDPEDSVSDADSVYNDEINAADDDGTTDTEPVPDEEETPDEPADDEDSDFTDSDNSDDDMPEISDDDIVLEPVFIKKPKSMNVAPKNKSVTLFCEVEAGGREVKYQWHETPERSTDAGNAI